MCKATKTKVSRKGRGINGPIDAQYFYEGFYYKLGRFGFVYQWIGGEWVKSQKKLDSVSRGKLARSGNYV